MDPYLELNWRDVHGQVVTYASAALNGVLPEDLVARIEERIVIDGVDHQRPRAIFPDVRVYSDQEGSSSGGAVSHSAVAEPVVLEFDVDRHTEKYITVTGPNGELISVIEFLSPGNKLPGATPGTYI